MTLTRRGALGGIVGTAGLLALGVRGGIRTDADRELAVEIVGDEEAYLRLVSADGEPLAAGTSYDAPHELRIGTLVDAPLTVDLTVERGPLVVDGERTRSLGSIDPGTERTVVLQTTAPAGGVGEIRLTARGLEDRLLVDLAREVAIEPAGTLGAVTLCRGRGQPCVRLAVLLAPSPAEPDSAVVVTTGPATVPDASGSPPSVPLDGAVTDVPLELGLAGGGTGNWRVTAASPSPDPPVTDLGPGDPVTVSPAGARLTVDPDATGPDGAVELAIALT